VEEGAEDGIVFGLDGSNELLELLALIVLVPLGCAVIGCKNIVETCERI
jgi:hypothetical protein